MTRAAVLHARWVDGQRLMVSDLARRRAVGRWRNLTLRDPVFARSQNAWQRCWVPLANHAASDRDAGGAMAQLYANGCLEFRRGCAHKRALLRLSGIECDVALQVGVNGEIPRPHGR